MTIKEKFEQAIKARKEMNSTPINIKKLDDIKNLSEDHPFRKLMEKRNTVATKPTVKPASDNGEALKKFRSSFMSKYANTNNKLIKSLIKIEDNNEN